MGLKWLTVRMVIAEGVMERMENSKGLEFLMVIEAVVEGTEGGPIEGLLKNLSGASS